MFVRVHTGAISGIEAVAVTAEVNVASGGIGLFIVGLPEIAPVCTLTNIYQCE